MSRASRAAYRPPAQDAPLFVAFQEIGGLTALVKSASALYGHEFQTVFARGTDTATGQNVGAILVSRGWGKLTDGYCRTFDNS